MLINYLKIAFGTRYGTQRVIIKKGNPFGNPMDNGANDES